MAWLNLQKKRNYMTINNHQQPLDWKLPRSLWQARKDDIGNKYVCECSALFLTQETGVSTQYELTVTFSWQGIESLDGTKHKTIKNVFTVIDSKLHVVS